MHCEKNQTLDLYSNKNGVELNLYVHGQIYYIKLLTLSGNKFGGQAFCICPIFYLLNISAWMFCNLDSSLDTYNNFVVAAQYIGTMFCFKTSKWIHLWLVQNYFYFEKL